MWPDIQNLFFYAQTVILLKSRSRIETDMNDIKVEIRTDMNDRPYITHGKVSEVSIFLLPDLLQQEKKPLIRMWALIGWIGVSGFLIG